jgi:DUF4097 and DUF4098 domain-containing protein YvlB
VEAHTSGGSITVKEVINYVDATTSGGSITASLSDQPTADCRLNTSGGTVTVLLPAGVQADVRAKTSGGRVHCDFPVKGSIGKRSMNVKINGGGPLLDLKTSGGSIYVKSN